MFELTRHVTPQRPDIPLTTQEIRDWARCENVSYLHHSTNIFPATNDASANEYNVNSHNEPEEYPIPSEIFDFMSSEEVDKLSHALTEYLYEPIFPSRALSKLVPRSWKSSPDLPQRNLKLHTLQSLFAEDTSELVTYELQDGNVDVEQLPKLLRHDAVILLLNSLIEQPEKYRFQIGALLMHIPYRQFPVALQDKIASTVTDNKLNITFGNENWNLCDTAEPRLLQTIKNKATLIVNDSLLVKFHGKRAALCTSTFTTRYGQAFYKGNWYSPANDLTKNELNESFDNGLSRITMTKGTWALIRGVDSTEKRSADEILDLAASYVLNTSVETPDRIDGLSRSWYRRSHFER
jgi:hypothetical protein